MCVCVAHILAVFSGHCFLDSEIFLRFVSVHALWWECSQQGRQRKTDIVSGGACHVQPISPVFAYFGAQFMGIVILLFFLVFGARQGRSGLDYSHPHYSVETLSD